MWVSCLWSATPIPYSGKVSINYINYSGYAQFYFSLVDANGTRHWNSADNENDTIKVLVKHGLYTVLLGGQGMNKIPADLFLKNNLFLEVNFENGDGNGMRHLSTNQSVNATP